MSTKLDERTDEKETTEKGKVAHIVRDKGKVTEAYILGSPVEALCGHVFVPTRDPKSYPVCQACKEIHELNGGREDQWNG